MNFIGLIFLSGYNIRKSEREYWSTDPHLRCDAFVECMSRNGFFKIKSFLHADDNQSLDEARMAKVKPLYNILNGKLNMFGVVHEDLSIDEPMVPYFGRHSCKQFIRAKPIRFGYKMWTLASATGFPYHVTIYEGKSKDATKEPLGTRVVQEALEICTSPQLHSVYFDNFFTSYQLLLDLDKAGFRATGTMRKDRAMKCPLEGVKKMKKSDRGSYDYRNSGVIEIVRWNYNAVVTLGSNAYGVEPVGPVKRWVKGKGRINIPQSAVIGAYNRGMGGVDLMDRALSDLRPVIHGKKWYWPLVVNALNIGFVYCSRLYRIVTDENNPQKDFRRHIVTILTKRVLPSVPARSRPVKTFKIPDEVRLDGIDHFPAPGSVRKCVVCKKSCRNTCEKCEHSMHVNTCFQLFHQP